VAPDVSQPSLPKKPSPKRKTSPVKKVRQETSPSQDQQVVTDAQLIAFLEDRFAGRISALMTAIQTAAKERPVTDADLAPLMPHIHKIFLSKILLRLMALGEEEEVASREVLSTLWQAGSEIMEGILGTSTQGGIVSTVGRKVEHLQRHIAHKEQRIVGKIQQAQQQIAKAQNRVNAQKK
jgi:hypothetical protein